MIQLNTILVAVTLLLVSTIGESQCAYDLDENGVINYDGDVFFHITQYGLDSTSYNGPYIFGDHNDNGVVDIRDLYNCIKHIGPACVEYDDYSGHILGLVLEELLVHDTAYYDTQDTIPAGSITYRLYLKVEDPEDVVMGIYGDEQAPLQISTSGEFFHTSSADTGVPLFGPAGPTNLAYLLFGPTLEYTSWIAVDGPPWQSENLCLFLSSTDDNWDANFSSGQDIAISSEVGGGWFDMDVWQTNYYDDPQLRAIGQFTVVGASDLYGQLNAVIKPGGTGLDNPFEETELLSFSLANLAVFGCTDAEAMNYDSLAEYDNGSCLGFGDFDGDGEVTIEDLLIFIEQFGCSTDCGDADMNNDGVVNAFDLLILLGYFGE